MDELVNSIADDAWQVEAAFHGIDLDTAGPVVSVPYLNQQEREPLIALLVDRLTPYRQQITDELLDELTDINQHLAVEALLRIKDR